MTTRMKRGQPVAVCYDGKWGRRVRGEVVAADAGSITVVFQRWASDDKKTVIHKFRRRSNGKKFGGLPHYHGGFIPAEDSVMVGLFGMPGEWYSVFKWKTKT